ncbi:MAG: sugar transferase [Anaerolineaceae bacterium]|nr:sugar transferase [Anaerolineaceae bacterium]
MSVKLFPSGIPVIKRLFDLLIAVPGLLILSPFLLLIAMAILIIEGWPIFFIQERPGYKCRIFQIIKFRTMHIATSPAPIEEDGQRLSRLGHILRSISLDELPELINIIRGEMSIVGPRPLLIQYLDRYTPEQLRRHEVLPGITGWAQVNGRNKLSWEEKFQLDVWYVDHWSIILDLRILIMTVLPVLKREGISQDGSMTAEEFKGDTH